MHVCAKRGWNSHYIHGWTLKKIHALLANIWAVFIQVFILYWNFEYTKAVTLYGAKSGRWYGSCNWGSTFWVKSTSIFFQCGVWWIILLQCPFIWSTYYLNHYYLVIIVKLHKTYTYTNLGLYHGCRLLVVAFLAGLCEQLETNILSIHKLKSACIVCGLKSACINRQLCMRKSVDAASLVHGLCIRLACWIVYLEWSFFLCPLRWPWISDRACILQPWGIVFVVATAIPPGLHYNNQ